LSKVNYCDFPEPAQAVAGPPRSWMEDGVSAGVSAQAGASSGTATTGIRVGMFGAGSGVSDRHRIVPDMEPSPRHPMTDVATQLEEVMADLGEYCADFLKPSEQAAAVARRVVRSAWPDTPEDMPEGVVSAVGDGGLIVQWDEDDRYVWLAVPADPEQAYIYVRGPEVKYTVRKVTGLALAGALRWLAQG
jgi:hypothetical protein